MDRKLKSLLALSILIAWINLLSSCAGTYSQLDWLEMTLKFDVKHKRSILVTGIYNNIPTALGFYRTVENMDSKQQKWIFKNSEGCQILYITILDKDDVPRVVEASIISPKYLCEKVLKYSSQLM